MSIGDSDLLVLFNALPPKCLLLLEDIDTVGLQRDVPGKSRKASRWAAAFPEIRDDEEDEGEEQPGRSRVSLSGLLNAIDGVAAPEGHILIMTTNKPEKLDEALVRSGRISVSVDFEKATGEQARDIFMGMYWHEEDGSGKDGSETESLAKAVRYSQLKTQARNFGEGIPDHVFSPADLQNFLLTRRKDPQRAIDEVEEWKVKTMEERAKKAGDETNRRKEKVKQNKRKMAKMMAMSRERQGAIYPSGSSTTTKRIIEVSDESMASSMTETAR